MVLTLGVLIQSPSLGARFVIHAFIMASSLLANTLKKMYCTLPNSEHTLEKQWVLRGQTQTSSGREPDSPDSSSPPPPLLKKFNAKYHLWTRGNKAIMEHTARQSKSKPVLLHLIPHSPAWRNKWAEASLSWAMHGVLALYWHSRLYQ